MESIPFSIVNRYLKERLLHPSRYTQGEFSFLKVYQHGISFALNGQKHKVIKNYLRLPYLFQLGIYFLKSLQPKKKKPQYSFKEFVILDPGRVVKDSNGKWHSIYFEKVGQAIGKDRLTSINLKENAEIEADYDITEFSDRHAFPDMRERKLLKEILASLKSARLHKQFTAYEMMQLQSAMHIFYEEFRFYYNIFKSQPTRSLLFICHYHKEGLIAAMKMLNIRCIELQHGLIATNDVYYIYHEQFASVMDKALFPDEIMVYGPYWKRLLENGCEFRSYQVHVAGDYLYRLSDLKKENANKENIILVCAQKGMHQDYVNYGKRLAAHLKGHPDWRAVVRLHPLEQRKDAYEELKDHGVEIIGTEYPLDKMLNKCKIQISIYSTTFYDALGFDVINFSLQDFGSMSDYASDMIKEGVAIPLSTEEDPVAKYLDVTKTGYDFLTRDDVYSVFNEAIVSEVIDPR